MKKKTVTKVAIGTAAGALACAVAYHIVKEKRLIDSFEDDFNDFDEEPVENKKTREPRKYTKILSRKFK